MTFIHCPICGETLTSKPIGDEGLIPFCERCGRPWFPFSYPCVICLCVDGNDNVTLIKQSYGDDRFVCVAGYVKHGESLESAARREVEEETGLCVLGVEYINSYPYEKRDNLMLGFVCRVERVPFRLSDEVKNATWFTLSEADEALEKSRIAQQLLRDYKNRT